MRNVKDARMMGGRFEEGGRSKEEGERRKEKCE